jgi:hypothetical protein
LFGSFSSSLLFYSFTVGTYYYGDVAFRLPVTNFNHPCWADVKAGRNDDNNNTKKGHLNKVKRLKKKKKRRSGSDETSWPVKGTEELLNKTNRQVKKKIEKTHASSSEGGGGGSVGTNDTSDDSKTGVHQSTQTPTCEEGGTLVVASIKTNVHQRGDYRLCSLFQSSAH